MALSLTVQAKTRDKRSVGAGALDWSDVCRHTDRMQIMLYNLHNKRTKPGPVATPEWIHRVLTYAKTKCDPGKIVPVIKVSGMHWGTAKSEARPIRHGNGSSEKHHGTLLREPKSLVPYFRYKENAKTGIAYYEDTRSIRKKIQTIQAMGINKIIFWSFGRQDPSFTDGLKRLALGKREDPLPK